MLIDIFLIKNRAELFFVSLIQRFLAMREFQIELGDFLHAHH